MLRVEPEIVANYVANGTVNLAFHHVLDHGARSQLTHLTAECAGQQSPVAFWQMHNLLFERQNEAWNGDAALMASWAGEIGLDPAAMAVCLSAPATAEKITRMDQARRDAGIRLRPSFDLNGQLIQGAVPYAQLQTLFDAQLAQ